MNQLSYLLFSRLERIHIDVDVDLISNDDEFDLDPE